MIMNKVKTFAQKNAAWVILLGLVFIFSILVPQFRTVNNLIIILRQVAVSGIMAIGVTFVLICGEIDLSTSAQIAVSGMICSLLVVNYNVPIYLAIPLTILATMVIGLINGSAVCFLHMPAMIATLGSMNIGSAPIPDLPDREIICIMERKGDKTNVNKRTKTHSTAAIR